MYVPNFIPPPIEISGRVAEDKWQVKVAFIKKTCLLFCVLTGASASIGFLFRYIQSPDAALSGIALLLAFILNALRTLARDSRLERTASLILSPLVVAGFGLLFNALLDRGVPVWGIPIGLACCTIFAYLAGRDFSFLGQLAFGFVVSSILIAFVSIDLGISPGGAAYAFGLNSAFVFYFVYDLNSILSRRRRGEEIHGALDFFRDIFNFVGYSIRCWHHWKEHKIFVTPKLP